MNIKKLPLIYGLYTVMILQIVNAIFITIHQLAVVPMDIFRPLSLQSFSGNNVKNVTKIIGDFNDIKNTGVKLTDYVCPTTLR